MPKLSVPTNIICFFVFISSIIVLTACKQDCSKTVPCPGYNDAVLDAWFPYFDKQVLIFKSNTNLYDTLVLNLTDSTIAYDYNTGLGRPNSGCNQTKSFASTKRDSVNYPAFGISLNSAQDAYSTVQKRSTSLNFYNNYFYGQDLGDNGFSNFSISGSEIITPQTFTNYAFNRIVYPIVQIVSGDSSITKIPGVYKIIYAKNHGIIGYETNPGGVSWIKQ